jgi:NAD-dependent deacetylase
MQVEGLDRLCDYLTQAKSAIALTGAGISADSGIPTFRGLQGLWEKYDIMEYAHIDAFRRDPAKVWRMLSELDQTILGARPNPAHTALAQLETMGLLKMVVTQNVDNLHQDAGSREVVEFHGNAKRFCCLECRTPATREDVEKSIPPKCVCGGLVKPDVIFFGEAIPWAANVKAFEAAKQADLVLVVGTSALVAPASEIPVVAGMSGAKVVEINREETVLTHQVSDLFLKGSAAEILPAAVERIQQRSH